MKQLVIALIVVSVAGVYAQNASDSTVAKIRAEGLQHSQVEPVFSELTVAIGPRLTASLAHKRAAEFVRQRLASYGVENARLEPWKFGRGWSLEKLTIEMIEPRYLPLIGYADAWSPSTNGDIVASPVFVDNRTPDEVTALAGQLKGAVVMTQPVMTNFVRKDRPQPSDPDYAPMSAAYATSVSNQGRSNTPTPAQRIAQAVRDAGAALILKPSTANTARCSSPAGREPPVPSRP
jgi:carboxypeptidase Q